MQERSATWWSIIPLLFCSVEDVVSKGIGKLVEQGKIELIEGTRSIHVPSHTLYADEIMVFCMQVPEGGMEIRSLITINEADNLKLCWDFRNYSQPWALFLKSRVIRRRKTIFYHIKSFIWSSVKFEFDTISNNSSWTKGTGENINFWNDAWCGDPLSIVLNIPHYVSAHLTTFYADFINEGNHWLEHPLGKNNLEHIHPSI